MVLPTTRSCSPGDPQAPHHSRSKQSCWSLIALRSNPLGKAPLNLTCSPQGPHTACFIVTHLRETGEAPEKQSWAAGLGWVLFFPRDPGTPPSVLPFPLGGAPEQEVNRYRMAVLRVVARGQQPGCSLSMLELTKPLLLHRAAWSLPAPMLWAAFH